MITLSAIRAWEHAEIERSRGEAVQTPLSRLVMDEPNIERYRDPSAETPYPLEYAFHLLGPVAGKTVLDYGCGNGENALLLARRKARVLGLDVSDALLSLARTRLALNGSTGMTTFFAGSAHDLPLPDHSVDVVFGIAILHHLDLQRAASEVLRVLRPGGRAIFQEPVRDSRMLKAIRRLVPYRAADVSDYERPLTTREIHQFSARYVLGRHRAFSLPFINLAQVLPVLERHVMSLYRLDGAVLRHARFLTPYAGIRVFELIKP